MAEEIKNAKIAGERAYNSEPRTVSAEYNKKAGRVVVDLTTGFSFMFPANLADELVGGSPSELSKVEVLARWLCYLLGKFRRCFKCARPFKWYIGV